jgi:glutathione S-transferase
MKAQVFGLPQSNYTRTVRMVCEEKSIPYELVPVVPGTDEARALHPFGKVPVLRHGDVQLAESKAIATYLESAFPAVPLFPRGGVELALVEQWVSLVNTVIDRTFVRDYVLGYFFAQQEGREADREAISAVLPALREQVGLLDRTVARTGFLAGDRFTYADLNLLPMLAGVQFYPEGAEALDKAPALRAYFATHSQRASFRATQPSQS